MLSPQTLSPYFVMNFLAAVLMFFYLIDPDVRHAFRVRNDEASGRWPLNGGLCPVHRGVIAMSGFPDWEAAYSY